MLTLRKGTGGAPDAARAMAEYLSEIPTESISIADYYLRGILRGDEQGAAAVPRVDMPPELVELLGFDMSRTATQDEVTNLLLGTRVDGKAIPGKRRARQIPGRDTITYVDFTFSAPQSISVAMALAPTPAERHVIIGAHRDAVHSAMLHLETIVGNARKGAGGSKGYVAGTMAWVSFDHYTARPAVEIPHVEADGTPSTLITSVVNPAVSADMQLHSHVITPNVVAGEDGSVGSLDTLALHDRVLEVGAIYQAYLSDNLRSAGVAVKLDSELGAATLPDVPKEISLVFSKRHHEGEDAAKAYVASLGHDWDSMSPEQLHGILRRGSRTTRRGKDNEALRGADFDRWKAEAARHGYSHQSVIRPELKHGLPKPRETRLVDAYQVSLPMLDRHFGRRAVMLSSVARTVAAQSLIATGIDTPHDVGQITELMRNHGVQHDGKLVPLVWGDVPPLDQGSPDDRRRRIKITTTHHIAMEERTIGLMEQASQDRSASLTAGEIDRAIARVAERDNLDFETDHGREQKRLIHALGTGGRVSVAVGVAGAGKSTLIRPLVEAWQNPERGLPRTVIGTANAWRQSSPLADANIPENLTMATARLELMVKLGRIKLDANTVIIVDELSQVGTRFALKLAEWQAEHGFTLVAIGDDKQAQAIDAGSTIALMRRALGQDDIPEILSSVRQIKARDAETALLFRAGKADEAISRLREDGHARLVPGGRRQAIDAVVDLWAARHKANQGRKDFSLTISTPTNFDARAIAAAIRNRRRNAGEVGPDRMIAQAVDQNGAQYDLPLAIGDRVRLFERTRGSVALARGRTRTRVIGNNGSVLTVTRVDEAGLDLVGERGVAGFVKWEELTDKRTGRIKLTYGDVISIDAIQSATSTEHINALPSGSETVEGFKAYVAQSRAREISWLVVPDGLERVEIEQRRAQGNTDPITVDDVWSNVGRNLSRQPAKELAVDFLEQATRLYRGQLRDLASAFQPGQEQARRGTRPSSAAQNARDEREVGAAAPEMAAGAEAIKQAAAQAADDIGAATRQAMRDARRAARPPAARPKPRQEERVRKVISEADAIAQFGDAIRAAGLLLKGDPIMDGNVHYVKVEGNRGKEKSGLYRGYLNGARPAGFIMNYKRDLKQTWKADSPIREMSPEERAAWEKKAAEDKAAVEEERRNKQAATARDARSIVRRSVPVTKHDYLDRKKIWSHGLRQNRAGHLILPMQDTQGLIWNVQTIRADSSKVYMTGGRKRGLFTVLGERQETDPIVILEGFATGATVREATGLAVHVVFDSGNILPAAEALRAAHPNATFIFMADNDHQLPRRSPPLPNVGINKAAEAAAAFGGHVIHPVFAEHEKLSDWNDVAARDGVDQVRRQLTAQLAPLGIQTRTWATAPVTQAVRDAARQQGRGMRRPMHRPVGERGSPVPRQEPEAPGPS